MKMKNTPKYVKLMKYMYVLENTYKVSFDTNNDYDHLWCVTLKNNITKDHRSLMSMLYYIARRGYVVRESSTTWRLTPAGLDLLNHGISAKRPSNLVNDIKAAKAENKELKQKLRSLEAANAALAEENNYYAAVIASLEHKVGILTEMLNGAESFDCSTMDGCAAALSKIAAKMAHMTA